ncbi:MULTISPECIES: hypothetical protein [Cytobacillus]|jgi:hypothetical protein|uniref:Uncharacterized protein n=1 Tax=Cytobacillus pseudoceanisediminis TaxID=3051614 RepID=A0ABZ2ZJ24_9BACI|nr:MULTISPECIES: hypothetical protein [Cytobacillus]EFV77203.1 hypothetical protein HMPREF1013_02575 [Bacillus sp. 2_A_57_CT2]MBY0158997.1 hypothetical protein [Cytobacillus firmus]MBU8730539.1 hypothetical protein [Cytobacillus oceanisediminis]MCM3242531.1 hypothetical protein [Cytobacillus oceanisediminis]MCM3392980.1 hypothetical protein [Cytobacillus oceanisediminis]
MEKREPQAGSAYFFDEQGTNEVSEQIMNAYNSGVIDQPNAEFDMKAHERNEGHLR